MSFLNRFFGRNNQTPAQQFPPLKTGTQNQRVMVDPTALPQFAGLDTPADWALWLMAEHGKFDGTAEDSDILADVGRILTGCQLTMWETTLADGSKDYQIEVGTTCPNFEAWFKTIKSQNPQQ